MNEASFFARFLWLDAANGHTASTIVLTQSTRFVLKLKTVWKMFSFCIFAGFNPVSHIMIAAVHTGGYAVIQVKHPREINLKLFF